MIPKQNSTEATLLISRFGRLALWVNATTVSMKSVESDTGFKRKTN